MKTPFRFFRSQTKGFALVIILALLVLSALLVIFMLQSSRTDTRSSSSFANVTRVRSVGDMAVNLVYAQIRDATTTNQTLQTPMADRNTWASQPGALRRFHNDGSLAEIYKLYSASRMRTASENLSGDIPTNWYSQPTRFVDLNSPVFTEESSPSTATNTHYPILDPRVASLSTIGTGIKNGFSIANAPLAAGASPNPAPMPALWLYVLRDGTVCELGDSRISKSSNPIVARFAFWTDDETSKVNINTASPSSSNAAWDIPRTASKEDIIDTYPGNYSWRQPAQNEYQRYTGHPATVSLRSILGSQYSDPAQYFKISPRYYWGGSEEGAKTLKLPRTSLLTNKEDRLYSSIDELLFDSARVKTGISPTTIERIGFFLTAHSRAPELNLFGQPRVTIWPINAEDTDQRRTPYDRLIAFCSTIGGKPYYFVRKNPLSTTEDFDSNQRNQEVFRYLQSLTNEPIPGFGGAFRSKYEQGSSERDQILTEIFDYIRCTNLNDTFANRDPNFLSYTPHWTSRTSSSHVETSADQYFDASGNVTMPGRGAGFVVPIKIGSNNGAGRFPFLSQAALWFVTRYDPTDPPDSEEKFENPARKRFVEAALIFQVTNPMQGYMPTWPAEGFNIEVKSSSLRARVGGNTVTLFPNTTTQRIEYPTMLSELGSQTIGGTEGSSYLLGGRNIYVAGKFTPIVYPFFSEPVPIDNVNLDGLSILGGNITVNFRSGTTTVRSYDLPFTSAASLPLPMEQNNDYRKTGATVLTDTHDAKKPWWYNRYIPSGFGMIPYPSDVIQSLELSHGDVRLSAMAGENVASSYFQAHKDYGASRFAHSLRGVVDTGSAACFSLEGATFGRYFRDIDYGSVPLPPRLISNWPSAFGTPEVRQIYQKIHNPDISSRIADILDVPKGWMGDYDNGISFFPDGPFLNKPDEGFQRAPTGKTERNPYLSPFWSLGEGLFSPTRQIPSAAMFGSLPTGVKAGIPWRTLLFCANPVAGSSHPGFRSPPDYLLLDLFTLPVVEPYAISEPFSTAGKINLNYALAPYSYIRRKSSWFALLETIKITAIPDSAAGTYKRPLSAADTFRKEIDVTETLKQFEMRFAQNRIFKSPSDICSMFFVPKGKTLEEMETFWSQHRLTGDNTREKPYAELYPKLTTQSNTYRVHVIAQILPQSGEAPSGGDFKHLAEYRGSYLIERYINPNDNRFASFGGSVDPDITCLNELYQFRTLEVRQFNP